MEEQTIGTDVNQVEITSLSHIKGQPHIQEVLRVSIDAFFQNRANNDKSTFGPVLLLGPSGTGKTLTAKAIHSELANLNLVESNGEMLNNTAELTSVLLTADDKCAFGKLEKNQNLSGGVDPLEGIAVGPRHPPFGV